MPPELDRVGGPGRAARMADDAPDRIIAGGVPCLLTDPLGERVILRIPGHVGEWQDRDRRHAGTDRRRRQRHNSRRRFARRPIPRGGAGGDDEGRECGGDRNEPASRSRLRLGRGGGLADFNRIDAQRLGDVFQCRRAEIADIHIKSRLDLPIGVLREADRAGLGDAFQARRDVDAVAHQVAVVLLHDVAEMDADAEFDALVSRDAGVALGHRVLHFDRAPHRVDHAAELDDRAVAGALDHPALVHGEGRIDQIAAQRPEPREGAVLVGAGETR